VDLKLVGEIGGEPVKSRRPEKIAIFLAVGPSPGLQIRAQMVDVGALGKRR
jgi:hypothetical protein